jgi:hypothetical protein
MKINNPAGMSRNGHLLEKNSVGGVKLSKGERYALGAAILIIVLTSLIKFSGWHHMEYEECLHLGNFVAKGIHWNWWQGGMYSGKPVFYLLLSLLITLIGKGAIGVVSLKVAFVVITLGFLGAVFALYRVLLSSEESAFIPLVFLILSPLFLSQYHKILPEIPALIFATLAGQVFILAIERDIRWFAILSGIFAVLAFFTSPFILVIFLTFIIAVCVNRIEDFALFILRHLFTLAYVFAGSWLLVSLALRFSYLEHWTIPGEYTAFSESLFKLAKSLGFLTPLCFFSLFRLHRKDVRIFLTWAGLLIVFYVFQMVRGRPISLGDYLGVIIPVGFLACQGGLFINEKLQNFIKSTLKIDIGTLTCYLAVLFIFILVLNMHIKLSNQLAKGVKTAYLNRVISPISSAFPRSPILFADEDTFNYMKFVNHSFPFYYLVKGYKPGSPEYPTYKEKFQYKYDGDYLTDIYSLHAYYLKNPVFLAGNPLGSWLREYKQARCFQVEGLPLYIVTLSSQVRPIDKKAFEYAGTLARRWKLERQFEK